MKGHLCRLPASIKRSLSTADLPALATAACYLRRCTVFTSEDARTGSGGHSWSSRQHAGKELQQKRPAYTVASGAPYLPGKSNASSLSLTQTAALFIFSNDLHLLVAHPFRRAWAMLPQPRPRSDAMSSDSAEARHLRQPQPGAQLWGLIEFATSTGLSYCVDTVCCPSTLLGRVARKRFQC